MKVFHITQTEHLATILLKGMPYGAEGSRSKEPAVAAVNEFLDRCRPKSIREKGLSRTKCLYMYAFLDGYIFDIQKTQLIPLASWQPGENESILEITLPAEMCYISSLDHYDAVLDAFADTAKTRKVTTLAAAYWRTLMPATQFIAHYSIRSGTAQRKATAPDTIPEHIGRIEVLVTGSIAPHAIRRFA